MTESPKPPQAADRLVATSSRPRPHRPARPAPAPPGVRVWQQTVAVLVWAVRVTSRLAALVLVLYALFKVFGANQANIWYQFVESMAGSLSLGLANLFELADARWTTLVDYGLAALVWLVIGSVVAGLIRRAAP
ncbi:hypothetical protein ABZ297_34860 [Nonomuraea sp. NPDC005983]|uniref:hypothetical protein n=1 Tax=Nonomuraea sp. NPDC005983 TaxID=3155595 RepID=UPI00339E0E1E